MTKKSNSASSTISIAPGRRLPDYLRGPPQDRRSLRSRRLLRLSPGRASCDAARHGAVAERVSRRAGAAHAAAALRTDGVRGAALSSAAADRGNLHARPDERRTAGAQLRPRRFADRARDLFGADPDAAQEIYNEGLRGHPQGLDRETLDFHGKHFSFDDVPMELEPLQKPHPPIWYGAHAPDSAARAAKRNFNIINLDPPARNAAVDRAIARRGRTHQGAAPLPKIGLGRFIVVAETDAQATRACAPRLSGLGSTASSICRGCAAATESSAAGGFRPSDGARPGPCRFTGDGRDLLAPARRDAAIMSSASSPSAT